MLFNSVEFIYFLLPLTFGVYFFLNKRHLCTAAKVWVLSASLFFYAWWEFSYLALLLLSIAINFSLGRVLSAAEHQHFPPKLTLTLGILFNVGLLGYFKYTNFLIDNINWLCGTDITLDRILLPLAISFFTFQQIAYLVDAYRGLTKEYNFLTYALFVSFFPQLIAGPIVHHKEIIPQFMRKRNLFLNFKNIYLGLVIFAFGLFKKTEIADTFAVWASSGFDQAEYLNFYAAWATSLSYTMQLYFDFSGYCDMAIGAALLFNIRLPINFYSPYKATSIQDFWRRWHITLSRFLRDYLYLPLGGNRKGQCRTLLNLFIIFLIGGIWHGAGNMFILWGALHGLALVVHRIWQGFHFKLYRWFAWLLTFLFVNAAWVAFRANDWASAQKVWLGMLDLDSALDPPSSRIRMVLIELENSGIQTVIYLILGLLFCLLLKNSAQILDFLSSNSSKLVRVLSVVFAALLLVRGTCHVCFESYSEFIYFNF